MRRKFLSFVFGHGGQANNCSMRRRRNASFASERMPATSPSLRLELAASDTIPRGFEVFRLRPTMACGRPLPPMRGQQEAQRASTSSCQECVRRCGCPECVRTMRAPSACPQHAFLHLCAAVSAASHRGLGTEMRRAASAPSCHWTWTLPTAAQSPAAVPTARRAAATTIRGRANRATVRPTRVCWLLGPSGHAHSPLRCTNAASTAH